MNMECISDWASRVSVLSTLTALLTRAELGHARQGDESDFAGWRHCLVSPWRRRDGWHGRLSQSTLGTRIWLSCSHGTDVLGRS